MPQHWESHFVENKKGSAPTLEVLHIVENLSLLRLVVSTA